jgi:diaminopimelate decarboxylase
MEEFSPGGGFAVQYITEKPAPPVSAYAEVITGSLKKACAHRGLDLPRLVIEPGRSIVGRAGVALYSVGAAKDIPGVRKYVSVDGGMGDNIRPAIYGAQYEALTANRVEGEATEKVTIAGKYCESGDILIKDIVMPSLRVGDVVAIPVSGAYCIPMSSNYNAAPRPPVVLVSKGEARLWRRRETYADLQQCDEEA